MPDNVNISVVIPTCNRSESLSRLLKSLDASVYPVREIIVVDSSDESAVNGELTSRFKLRCLTSARSVCIQRNVGIAAAEGNWIFLCDDDLEVPPDYIGRLADHIERFPDAGCVTGNVLQNNGKGNTWTEQYPITSSLELVVRFIFQLSVWGEIKIAKPGVVVRKIMRHYESKGNHLSKAGWPVITDFSGLFFRAPFYGLGASIVKKQWLLMSPYDEVLDPHGIGDNYGVASGFPPEGIHIVNDAFVYHYRASENRLIRPDLYYRRILALDYFLRTKKELLHVQRVWFLWSLIGSTLMSLSSGFKMTVINLKLLYQTTTGRNPYLATKNAGGKVTIPEW
jgi:glycosyltransferase involved in cell wall biosynthesis